MRIIIVNPNNSETVTAMLLREARLAAADATELRAVTARSGLAVIRTVADDQRADDAVVEALVEAGMDRDAGIVGGFTEPGLASARARMRYPLTGIGEASLAEAGRDGKRFSILTSDAATIPGIEAVVDRNGLAAQLASILSTDDGLLAVAGDQQAFDTTFCRLAVDAAARDGADAVVLGGAVFVGMAARIGRRVPVPVIDPIHAAVRRAEALAASGR